ncbi:MAG: YtxH domain-containing protein [Anaerolineae bacterium]
MSLMSRDFWMGIVVGAAAGFVAAILTAPEPGEQVREKIQARGIELKDKAMAAGEEAQRKAEDLQRQAQDIQRKASQAVGQEVQKVSHTIEQQIERMEGAQSCPPQTEPPTAAV